MRWLVIHPGPDFSVSDVHNGLTEALSDLGEQVAVYNLNDRLRFFAAALFETGQKDEHGAVSLRKACTRDEALAMATEPLGAQVLYAMPDVILGVSAFFTPPPLLDVFRRHKFKVVLWHTESPYQDAEQLERAAHADLNIVNDPVSLDAYREFGPAEYIPHSYRPSVHHPAPAVPHLKSDLAFVGTGFASRRRFFEQMNLDGMDVLLAGTWPGLPADHPLRRFVADPEMASEQGAVRCLDNDQTARIYQSAKTGINLYRREGEDGHADGIACGPREIEMAACGLWFARDSRPEGDALLPLLPVFTGPGEASELIRWALGHDDEREKAAAAAREAVAGRTFGAAARRLLELVSE